MEVIYSFHVFNAYKHLSGTRCKPWDNRELDVLDGAKYFSFMLTTIS